jgi:hypothetical protein
MASEVIQMKHLFAMLALALTVAGCSSGGNDAPALSPFQKASGGQWLSECQNDNNGAFKETLVLNGTTGTSTSQYYQNGDCSGAIVRTDGPNNFTYSSVNKAGGKDGEAKVTINVPGRPGVEVDVVVQGNTMVIISPNGTVIYQRIGGGPGKQGAPGTPMAAFDAAAKGNWVSKDCSVLNNGAGSYYQVLTIAGGGAAKTVYNVYQGGQCQGNPTPQGQQDINYTVDRYANGGGQLTVNGQPIDVTIQGAQLTLSSVNGTTTYLRIR